LRHFAEASQGHNKASDSAAPDFGRIGRNAAMAQTLSVRGQPVRQRLPGASISRIETGLRCATTLRIAAMFGATSDRPLTVGFLLVPNFSMMAFASAVEPLRSANRQSGEELYRWRLFSADGSPVVASNGIPVMPHAAIRDAGPLGMAVVCAGIDVERYNDRAAFAWLRRLARSGCDVGALSTGAHVLARAGLLEGRRCALHWENAPAFAEAFPNVSVSSEIFVIDGNRFTCSGGTAALDMMLYLIRTQHGHALATAVSEQFIHGQIRDHDDPQRMQLRTRIGVAHPKLLAAVATMEANVEAPRSAAALARQARVSPRQLERLFRKYLGCTPTQYYLEVRLARARQLLTQTSQSILGVALACGFVSASHFSKCFRTHFGFTPREARSRFEPPARRVAAPAGRAAARAGATDKRQPTRRAMS
jgi:transcriptional regulator GlxA family with amidase domain